MLQYVIFVSTVLAVPIVLFCEIIYRVAPIRYRKNAPWPQVNRFMDGIK